MQFSLPSNLSIYFTLVVAFIRKWTLVQTCFAFQDACLAISAYACMAECYLLNKMES